MKYIDLFCGVGGFRIAAEQVFSLRGIGHQCVFSCDIDIHAREAYEANFGDVPAGDVSQVSADSVPDHNILFAGFPCQPFSIIGDMKGFEDTRGTLFFEIARIIDAKRPEAFILENVKMLVGHQKGRTIKHIMATLQDLGYYADYRVLNALHFGLPQKRERVFIVGLRRKNDFQWPEGSGDYAPLSTIIEPDVDSKHFTSAHIRQSRLSKLEEKPLGGGLTIWHENKSGHVSVYPFSCALRAGASYNYLLVNGERRLTPREMLRLQGFPDSFKIVCSDFQTRKQAGNAVPPPMVAAVLERLLDSMGVLGQNTEGADCAADAHA